MGASVVGKIDVSKIDKAKLYRGAKGTYLDIALIEGKDGPDQYGNDGFIVQSVSKAARDAGERGPIIGNWKHLVVRAAAPARPAASSAAAPDGGGAGGDGDGLPF